MTGYTQRLFAALLLAGCAVLLGCSRSGSAAKGPHVFDAAAPEIKQAWNQAVEADKANDYVTAISTYKQILNQQTNLQEAQITEVREALGLLNQRLVAASMKGDTAARQALTDLGSMNREQAKPH